MNSRDRLQLLQGDITTLAVDAIVNAANSTLMGGGGVDGAIHRAGGPSILQECRIIVSQNGSCPTGSAVITNGGLLPSPYVIHTVGPVWQPGNEKENAKLADCYSNSLRLALDHNLRTIAFPNISTGIYRFPREEAAEIAINTVKHFLEQHAAIETVFFVCFDDENFRIYTRLLS